MNLLLYHDLTIPTKLIEGLTQRLEAQACTLPLKPAQQNILAQARYVFFIDTQLYKGVPDVLQTLPTGNYAFALIALQEPASFPPAFDALGYWAVKRGLGCIAQLKMTLPHWSEQLPQIIRAIQQQQQRYEAPFPQLESPRSILRKPRFEDAAAFLELHRNTAINRYVPKATTPTLKQAKLILQQSWQDYQLRQGITWLAEDKQQQTLIGGIGFTNWLPEQRTAEFGGRLFPRYWGSRRALQASQRVISFGFEQMGLHRIEAQMLSQNRSAIRIAELLGFKREGVLQDKVLEQQHFYDVEIWSLFCE